MALNTVLSWVMRKRVHQIELFKKYPQEVQKELLDKLLQQAKSTEWGKKYKFQDIKSIADFKKAIPLQDYEGFKHDILRMKEGEQNILWPTEVKWFAKSSGTTSDKSKYIPVSRESLEDCHYKGGKDLISMYYNCNTKANLYSGMSLVVGGSSTPIALGEDSYSGDLSAIIIKNLPFWVEYRRVPDSSVALMDKWEEKIERMATSTMNEDVTNITGVPSWTLLILKRILELKGANNIHEVWPNLELFMHGGVNFAPYKDQYEQLMPNGINYFQSYNASEGFFGIQDSLHTDDMLLMLDYGIFYEFIPMSQLDEPEPQSLTLAEVELHTNYAIAITTNGGLWRYLIGDTIMFTNLSPHRIKVTGRTKHFINAFGEEVIIDNAEQALMHACQITGASISDYTAAPIYMSNHGKGAHQWIIEFENKPNSLDVFTIELDKKLQEINSDYEAKRTNSLSLKLPEVISAPKGTFYQWLKNKNKLGGQHKVPRLANDRKIVEEILGLLPITVV
ncbi:MAG: hypothetical protein ACJAUV_001053 [Flavobacteriales bacterium]|jgi:hypothetical protein